MNRCGGIDLGDDSGSVTVEAAIALATVIVAVVLCLGALLAASTQVRCVDAAREAARLAARGDEANALTAAHRVAPPSADISLRIEGTYVIARVTARAPLLPLLTLHADAVATREPGSAQ
ncbi:TadE family type IV pilus minor pilin [Nocardia brasiliensis]|uniref:TadE family type IV pilus minor pilin n=1 Tax=Nocardia brasiliensis TaxID=37326 RepID=UPI001E53D319|nr:TadE family type IV pilus minor pilin [Nocardia brasiliensis]